jgi:alcohol dehydrogenase
MSVFSMYVPTRILFGAGRLNELHEQKLFGKKALIVISCGKSTRTNGYLDRTVRELETAGIDSVVFDRIQPNPLKSTVEEGAAFAKQNGCDFIVALGGGSVMDSAKAIAIMTTNPGDLWDYAMGGTGKKSAGCGNAAADRCDYDDSRHRQRSRRGRRYNERNNA